MLHIVAPLAITFILGSGAWRIYRWGNPTFETIFISLLASGTTSYALWLAQ